MADYSTRIRELRKENKLTQQEVADYLKVNKQTISGYERGVRRPDFVKLDALADLFNVSLAYLIGSQDERGSYPKHGTPELPDPEEAAILEAYRKAPEDVQRLVLYALRLRS